MKEHHLTSPSGWYTPLQARKPRIIVIERDPLAAGLDGQCRKPCIRHKVAACVRFGAKALKNPPVSFTRLYDDALGLSEKNVAESEHLIQAAGHYKNFRVGGDTDHTAQNLWSHTVTGVTINDTIEPGAASQMRGGIAAKRVHKDVDIG